MTRLPSLFAGIAAAAMAASPIAASAATMPLHPHEAPAAYAAPVSYRTGESADYGRYRRGYHHHHDGITGGDALAGVAIIGGLLALATVKQHPHEDRYDPRYEERYRDPQYDPRYHDQRYRQVPQAAPYRDDGQAYNDRAYDAQYSDDTYYNARARTAPPPPDAQRGSYADDGYAGGSTYPGGPPRGYEDGYRGG